MISFCEAIEQSFLAKSFSLFYHLLPIFYLEQNEDKSFPAKDDAIDQIAWQAIRSSQLVP